jgi:hypothetical protein
VPWIPISKPRRGRRRDTPKPDPSGYRRTMVPPSFETYPQFGACNRRVPGAFSSAGWASAGRLVSRSRAAVRPAHRRCGEPLRSAFGSSRSS